jgi:anthranilate synthase component 1
MQSFEVSASDRQMNFAQRLFGYTAYDAIPFFESLPFSDKSYSGATTGNRFFKSSSVALPLMRYRLYQYIIAIDHFRDELYLLENHADGIEGDKETIENIICSRDIPGIS